MHSDFVGLRGKPRQIQPFRALLLRAYRVLPVKAGNKVAAGVADNGNIQLFDHVQHIPAEALFISQRMIRLIDAAVHSPAQMLDERAVNARVNAGDDVVLVQDDGSGFHGHTLLLFIPIVSR